MAIHRAQPKTFDELRQLVHAETAVHGMGCDLNHIDTSNITSLAYLFCEVPFQGDISQWDVSKVQNAEHAFYNSAFNGDIRNWKLTRLDYAPKMFHYSQFAGDLSQWELPSMTRNHDMLPPGFKGVLPNWKNFAPAWDFYYREFVEQRAFLRARMQEWDGTSPLRPAIALALFVCHKEHHSLTENCSEQWTTFCKKTVPILKIIKGLGISLYSSEALDIAQSHLVQQNLNQEAIHIDMGI